MSSKVLRMDSDFKNTRIWDAMPLSPSIGPRGVRFIELTCPGGMEIGGTSTVG